MWDVIVHDLRLEGECGSGRFTVVPVGRSNSLSSVVTWIRNVATVRGGDIRIKVFAHGLYRNGRGGMGIQMGADNITLQTVEQLRPLHGLVAYGIDIYACGAAQMQRGGRRGHGNGRMLCRRIAEVTGTFVRAAEFEQDYHTLGDLWPIDFGEWEGRVLTFGPRGDVVQVQNNPRE
jgi:hypothetical protein